MRSTFLKLIALVFVTTLLFTGCSGDDSTTPSSSTTTDTNTTDTNTTDTIERTVLDTTTQFE